MTVGIALCILVILAGSTWHPDSQEC